MTNLERVKERIEKAKYMKDQAHKENDKEMECYFSGQISGMLATLHMLGLKIED